MAQPDRYAFNMRSLRTEHLPFPGLRTGVGVLTGAPVVTGQSWPALARTLFCLSSSSFSERHELLKNLEPRLLNFLIPFRAEIREFR